MTGWTPQELSTAQSLFEGGLPPAQIALRVDKTLGQVYGVSMRGNWSRPARGRALMVRPGHPALVEQRSIFPFQVRDAADVPQLLKPGRDQRKLGSHVSKGAWRGMPIYSLTLEERATCPLTCHHWRSCMGNTMHKARRIRHSADFEQRLEAELADLQRRHPGGFVVRLHILGDFYSLVYAYRWGDWLDTFPALHVFGYTAWPSAWPIGAAIDTLTATRWDRFAIRRSSTTSGPGAAITLWENDAAPAGAIVCPVETRRTRSCGTCGLCWSPAARDRTIAFIAHGR